MKAAVLPAIGSPIETHDDIEIAAPGPGEVRIRMEASGVCHSDLSVQNGTIPIPTPVVLGHEGAGVVDAVGEGVTKVKVGDHVALSFVPACGTAACANTTSPSCARASNAQGAGGLLDGTTRLSREGAPLHQMAFLGTYGTFAIVPEISTVVIPDDVPFDVAALIGCGVLTGVEAALNTADIKPGDTVAVIGCGGVGLNVIQGARIAGAGKIIAVDRYPSKLEMAQKFGATDVVAVDDGDPVMAVMGLSEGRGADVTFEVIGLGQTIEQAINATRKGGEIVLVGVPRLDVMVNLNAAFTWLYLAKTIKGCWYGSADVHRDVPKLLDLWKKGDLMLEQLISKEITVDQINEAFADMEAGNVARSVIRHNHG